MTARHPFASQAIHAHEACLNITFEGQNGDLGDPVPFRASDRDLRAWAAEAVRTGSIAGIRPDHRADLGQFVVDRFAASATVPFNRIVVRPVTPFG
jgi:hypothetical protein